MIRSALFQVQSHCHSPCVLLNKTDKKLKSKADLRFISVVSIKIKNCIFCEIATGKCVCTVRQFGNTPVTSPTSDGNSAVTQNGVSDRWMPRYRYLHPLAVTHIRQLTSTSFQLGAWDTRGKFQELSFSEELKVVPEPRSSTFIKKYELLIQIKINLEKLFNVDWRTIVLQTFRPYTVLISLYHGW